jgi:hypothetical protein
MQGIKEFFTMGGGGGAGMFSLTEWIMKGAVWLVLLSFVCLGYRMEQRSYGVVSAEVSGDCSLLGVCLSSITQDGFALSGSSWVPDTGLWK